MTLLSVGAISERALRKIGEYPIRGGSLRPEALAETRIWLDMVMSHQSGKMRTPWLVAATVNFDLVATQAAYDLRETIGANVVPDGMQFNITAYLYDPATSEDVRKIALLRREEYEDIQDKTRPGEPECAYIDRTRWPVMTLHPVPNGNRALQIRLVYQQISSQFANLPFNDRTYAMHECWNLWVVTALAAEIGDGPVRRLPKDEVAEMRSTARMLLLDLEAYDQFEQADEPRRVAAWNGID